MKAYTLLRLFKLVILCIYIRTHSLYKLNFQNILLSLINQGILALSGTLQKIKSYFWVSHAILFLVLRLLTVRLQVHYILIYYYIVQYRADLFVSTK